MEVCACLGLLKDGQAERLRTAGVDAYNHNINTAESHHDAVVQTHTYEDRVDTIGRATSAGLSPCSGSSPASARATNSSSRRSSRCGTSTWTRSR